MLPVQTEVYITMHSMYCLLRVNHFLHNCLTVSVMPGPCKLSRMSPTRAMPVDANAPKRAAPACREHIIQAGCVRAALLNNAVIESQALQCCQGAACLAMAAAIASLLTIRHTGSV